MLREKSLRTVLNTMQFFPKTWNHFVQNCCIGNTKPAQRHFSLFPRKMGTYPEVTNFNVQLLPVIAPCSDYPKGKILLCNWKTGDYKGRYTGLFKSLENPGHQYTGSALRKFLDDTCDFLVPIATRKYLDGIELKGVLRFDGPPDCDEYIYLVSYKKSMLIQKTTFLEFDGNRCFWFDWDQIPYEKMPADDEIWYSEILYEGKKIRGSFVFGGLQERNVKSYELFQVDNFSYQY